MAVVINGMVTGGIKPAPGTVGALGPRSTAGAAEATSAVAQTAQQMTEDVDTSIDTTGLPTQATQAEVEKLDPPTDISAAQIEDYTPYTADERTVDPESTVEGRLSGLLSQQSDYMQQARAQGQRMAARRGMLNTSMAAGAAQGAAIDRALPIAQQDAQAHLEQQFRNQGYSNEAAKMAAQKEFEQNMAQAGLEQQTNEFNQENRLINERLNAQAQNAANMSFADQQNKNDFAVLSAGIQAQLAKVDNQLAQSMEYLSSTYDIMENLDSINGSIYQQLVANMGTILANEDKVSVAQSKINNLLKAAGLEFAFSNGQEIGSGGAGPTKISGGGGSSGGSTKKKKKKCHSGQRLWLGRCVDRSCFTGDTLVTMADGTSKEIADIEIGDRVLGMNGEENTVIDIEVPKVGSREVWSFNDGKPFVTEEHPFMCSDGWWHSINPNATIAEQSQFGGTIKQLEVGKFIERLGDPLFELEKLEPHYFDPETPVYNLLLNGNHTYYANELLVHNKSCFIAGTQVRMADGTDKNIEEIQVGEVLLGMDDEPNTVKEWDHPLLAGRQLYSINGSDHFVTWDHAFMTPDGWKAINPDAAHEESPDLEINELEVGDQIVQLDGPPLEIMTLDAVDADPDMRVYNFKLHDGSNHTYYADGHLVHNKAGDGPGSSCFVAGTMVIMKNGELKAIEDVQIGDNLLSENGHCTVLAFDHPKLGSRILYQINGGQHFVTAEHPFATLEGWKSFDPEATARENPDLEVGQLGLGDYIKMNDVSYTKIEQIGTTTADPETQLYNFKLDGDHSYYANHMLVHNKGGSGKIICTSLNKAYGLNQIHQYIWLKHDQKVGNGDLAELGYHKLFTPIAKRIREADECGCNERLARIMNHFVQVRTARLRRELAGLKPTLRQRLYKWLLRPPCVAVGWLISKGILEKVDVRR